MKPALLAASIFILSANAAEPPAFDVASIKPTAHGRNAEGWSFSDVKIASPGRFVGTNASLDELIRWAWGLQEHEVSEPAWMKSGAPCFDVEAKAPPSTSRDEMRAMARTLITNRFQLSVHSETRLLPVYEIVVAKNGPKLQPGAGKPGFTSRGSRGGVKVDSENATMASLADRLSRDLDRPVFDKTGIDGSYKISLEWAREGDGPSVFSVLQEQLGLRLQAAKASVETLVVDRAEKIPTAN